MFFLELVKLSYSNLTKDNNQTTTVLGQSKSCIWPISLWQTGNYNGKNKYPTLWYSAHCDAHASLAQTMNKSSIEKPMKEEVSNENGEHVEVQDEVTYFSLPGDEDFASEPISR